MATAAQRALQHAQTLTWHRDAGNDQLLALLVEALTVGVERIFLVAHGDEAAIAPGAALTNPAVAPLWALPYSAQYTGGRVPPAMPGETEEAYLARARQRALGPAGKGSTGAIKAAVRPLLTGSQWMNVITWVGGSRWEATIVTRTFETPDPAAVVAAANDPAVILAGVKVGHTMSDVPIIDEWTRVIDLTTVVIDDIDSLDDVT